MKRPSRTAATRLRRKRHASTKPVVYTTNECHPVVAGSQDASAAKVANRTANRRKSRPGQTQPLTIFSFFGMSLSENTVIALEPHCEPTAPIRNLGSAGCPGPEFFGYRLQQGSHGEFRTCRIRTVTTTATGLPPKDPSVFDRRQ